MVLQWLLLASAAVAGSLGASIANDPVKERKLFETPQCTVGSSPKDLSSFGESVDDLDFSKLIVFNDYIFLCDGWIESWLLYAESPGTIYATVMRPQKDREVIRLVGYNRLVVVNSGPNEHEIGLLQRLRVTPGDLLALAWEDPSETVLTMTKTEKSNDKPKQSTYFEVDTSLPANALVEKFEHDIPAVNSILYYAIGIQASVVDVTKMLRLVPNAGVGNGRHSGKAELMQNGRWGSVCDTWFHTFGWPNLFCKALGFPESESAHYVTGEDLTQPDYMKNVRCKPSDGKPFVSCPKTAYSKCDHTQNVFITCKRRVRLQGGTNRCRGIPSIWHLGYWGSICDESYENHDPQWHLDYPASSWTTAFCRELGCSNFAKNVTRADEMVDELGSFHDTEKETYRNPSCTIDWPDQMTECPPHAGQKCINSHMFFLVCEDQEVILDTS